MFVVVKVDTYGRPFGDVKLLGVYGPFELRESADEYVKNTVTRYGHKLVVQEIETLEALEETIKKGKF